MLHCNGRDPFITLMGNFDWGPILRNDIVSTKLPSRHCFFHYTGNKLKGDMGDIVSIQAQTSPFFQRREKFRTNRQVKSRLNLSLKPENLYKMSPNFR